jgi:chromate transport protein ChrA
MNEELFWDLTLVSVIGAIVVGIVYIISIVWSYNDAKKRGVNGLIVALLVAFVAWPLSFIGWLIVRPSKKEYQHH